MKKVLVLSILLLLICAAICLPAYAEGEEDAVRNGILFGEGFAYVLKDGQATIVIPSSVTSIGMRAAEEYAQENGIAYIYGDSTADELLMEQIDGFLTMSREEIIKKLGPDYSVEFVGPEGALDGYYYEDLGMAFAFYADSDIPDFIECYPNFKIYGVGIGSLFPEIVEALGDTEVFETWLAHPDDKAFIAYYQLGDAMYSFVAFEEDGPVYILRIR